jgi:hypothetical protein
MGRILYASSHTSLEERADGGVAILCRCERLFVQGMGKAPSIGRHETGAMLAGTQNACRRCEINNTFYQMPKVAVLESWAARRRTAFRFAIKASRRITASGALERREQLPAPSITCTRILAALGAIAWPRPVPAATVPEKGSAEAVGVSADAAEAHGARVRVPQRHLVRRMTSMPCFANTARACAFPNARTSAHRHG